MPLLFFFVLYFSCVGGKDGDVIGWRFVVPSNGVNSIMNNFDNFELSHYEIEDYVQ